MSVNHVDRDELGPEDIATLDENWKTANEHLDRLLAMNGRHRANGCPDWFCGDDELTDLITGYEQHQVQMVLRAAIERLTTARL